MNVAPGFARVVMCPIPPPHCLQPSCTSNGNPLCRSASAWKGLRLECAVQHQISSARRLWPVCMGAGEYHTHGWLLCLPVFSALATDTSHSGPANLVDAAGCGSTRSMASHYSRSTVWHRMQMYDDFAPSRRLAGTRYHITQRHLSAWSSEQTCEPARSLRRITAVRQNLQVLAQYAPVCLAAPASTPDGARPGEGGQQRVR